MKSIMYYGGVVMVNLEYEHQARELGFRSVCGIDEAGRGPLAGPVFAAAVILPEGIVFEGLDDSKKLSEKKREKLFEMITSPDSGVIFSVAQASEREIDTYNILNATFLAMRRAAEGLREQPEFALVDGNRDPHLKVPALCVVGGDGKSASIAAASVLAKVSRDRYMLKLDEQFPCYGFAQHKGYPTQLHYQMLLEHGVSEVHRVSFLKNLDEKRALYGNQES